MSTHEKWTARDEVSYNEMKERRDRIMGARRAAVEKAVKTFGCSDSMMLDISDWLILNADCVRDALMPYDSGVRVDERRDPDWIEWGGGDLPVPHGADVCVRYRDGDVRIGRAGDAYMTRWVHKGAPDDIVAYRVVP